MNQGLGEDDERHFWLAATAARHLDIDPWDAWFERQRSRRSSAWYQLMQTNDPQRASRVLELARQQLDLAHIASGPGSALGLGPEYRQHSALDFILQDLGRFPVQGWDLVTTGLASPVVRNRHMALKTLAAWGRNQWPADTLQLLRRTLDREPEQSVRERIAECCSRSWWKRRRARRSERGGVVMAPACVSCCERDAEPQARCFPGIHAPVTPTAWVSLRSTPPYASRCAPSVMRTWRKILPKRLEQRPNAPFRRPSAIVVSGVERQGCRERRTGPWMARYAGHGWPVTPGP